MDFEREVSTKSIGYSYSTFVGFEGNTNRIIAKFFSRVQKLVTMKMAVAC